MKKIQLVSILIVALLFPISGNADKDKDVNVINTPMVEVVNTEPLPVTMTESNGSEVVSYFAVTTVTPQTLFTVPADKTFILTDIIHGSGNGAYFIFTENDKIKIKVYLKSSDEIGESIYTSSSIHLESGVPFASQTEVKVTSSVRSEVTITGYLSDN